ncbi:MAG: hypothetical protein CSA96_06535 [Bacteroidetes bacterium]|nr:MAG: hypothetical protein CSA96_06535 [Bacteroidota bacterium]
MKEGVSVIICCYNSEQRIGKVLSHLSLQEETDGFDWEIIVVDNASSDRTAEVARQNWQRAEVAFQIVHEPEPGLSNARKRGLASAAYDIIVFVDDDNLLAAQYIARAYQIMRQHPEVGLAGGLGKAVSTIPLPAWFREYESAYAVGEQSHEAGYLPSERTYLHGAGVVMRKDAWDRILDRGFHFMLSGRKGKSLSSGEDSEISYAFRLAGYRLWYDPKLCFDHLLGESRLQWPYLLKLARAFGHSFVALELYRKELMELRGWEARKTDSLCLGFLVNLYHLLKLYPRYLRCKTKNAEGCQDEMSFHYRKGIMQAQVQSIGSFGSLKKELKTLHRQLAIKP